MRRIFSFVLIVLIFSACQKEKRLIHLAAYRIKIDQMFKKTRAMAAGRDSAMFSVVDGPVTAAEKDALKFLLAFAPLSDIADCDGEYFLSQVRATLKAREEMPWGKDIPEEVFLHFVLPVRVNNENLDTFRSACYEELKQRVQKMNLHDAALEVNHWCHEKVTYKGSDERTSSPLASIRTSWGRCGEESTFTVAALRAVGIPARQVYTPRWAHSDDNHAWVEVWVDGKWYFMGACEPEPGLNKGWFEGPSKRTMLVHTRAYGYYMGKEDVIDRQERFSELNLIDNYAPSKIFSVKVTDAKGKAVDHARVEFRLYNYAEFYPIARLFTGADGKVSITSGLGDLLIWATDGQNIAYQKISVAKTGEVLLTLQSGIKTDVTENLDIIPPPRPEAGPADTAGQVFNKRRIEKEDSARKSYMSTFRDSAWSAEFAVKYKLPADSARNIFYKSQGNWKSIKKYLTDCPENKRKFAFKLLYTLSEKDLRDVTAEILTDHLKNLPVNNYGKTYADDKDVYLWYVASPRIHNEMIRKWRTELKRSFNDLSFANSVLVPKLAEWIKTNIKMDDLSNLHSRAPISPYGLLQLKVSDNRSRNIFFVAACRSLGVAARINPVTLLPEYWMNGTWNLMKWEEQKESQRISGYVNFVPSNTSIDGRYMQHFTISKLEKGRLSLYEFEEGKKLSEFPDRIELDTGLYLLTTGNRMSDGGVLSTLHFFRISKGQTSDVLLSIREPKLDFKELKSLTLEDFTFLTADKKNKIPGKSLLNNSGIILIWLEPLQEPSRHILVDIPPFKESFENWSGKIVFIFCDQDKIQLPDRHTLEALPKNAVYLVDENNSLMKNIEKNNEAVFSSNLPLVVFAEPTAKSWIISEGYSIGTGEMLARLIKK
ncbi:MAG: transglutaminase domain-containing protein [Bacteroidales bacterium]